MKRLEAEYNMFFAGRLPRPPWETRRRVEAMVKRLDRLHSATTATASGSRRCSRASRPSSISGIAGCARARKDGPVRSRSRGRRAEEPKPKRPEDRILHVTTFNDPLQEMDKLHELYDSLAEARREAGQEAIPFHKFADLIKTQVSTMKEKGSRRWRFAWR